MQRARGVYQLYLDREVIGQGLERRNGMADFDAEETDCPACGTRFATAGAERCPDCGLRFA